jgi:serine/threonine protein kinase
MDYVQGETLSRVWRLLRERGETAPAAVTASVLAGVLHGLHAAHEAKDDKGKPLDIVHRDVSPQNVMIGVDGVARLLDFGVAKATVRLQTTQEGHVKGKLAYMAPELLETHEVTRIADVYAVGVMLWEGLTGKRLFEAQTEGMLVRRVLEGASEPPSVAAAARNTPRELDAIVMRALAKKPEERYATAREMALALERTTEIARASQVSEWLERVAKPLLDERAARVAELRSSVDAPPSLPKAPPSRGSSSSVKRVEKELLTTPEAPAPSRTPPPRARTGLEGTPTPGTPSRRTKRRVLAIDDSEIILGKIKTALEEDGIEVITTTRTVGSARHLVDCDLVIIDYHMPGLDGGSVIASLRAAAQTSKNPVLFYLYTQDAAVAKDYAKLGFDGCFSAKGDERELVRQVRAAFRLLGMRALKR